MPLKEKTYPHLPFYVSFIPSLHFPGVHSGGDPPVPIPNTAVKPASADNTRGASPRKDRSMPGKYTRDDPANPVNRRVISF
jgi:hypothetical protein